jgi:predicted Zn-dependent protease
MTIPLVNSVRPAAPRLRWWGIAAAVVGALTLAGVCAWPWLHEWAELREALRLAEENRFDEAEPLLLRLHEHRPRNVAVVRALALGYYDARQLTATERFLDRWCQLQPKATEPYRRRLQFLMMQQKVLPAITDAKHLLELKPTDSETRKSLTELLMAAGRYEQAEQEGIQCFRENSKDVDVWFDLAQIYYALGQGSGGETARHKAADLTDQVLHVTPDHIGALKFRAKLYVDAGQPETAIRLLKEHVVGTDGPEGIEGLFELSEALRRAGRMEEAKQVQREREWHEAKSLWTKYEHRDENVGLQERVVEGMLAAGKSADAVQFLTGILERNPQALPGTHRLLAICYEKQGQPEGAAEQRRLAEAGSGDKEAMRQEAKEKR